MKSIGFVVFNTFSNDYLASMTRTHHGTVRYYVRTPQEARLYRSVRRAKEAFISSPRVSEMVVCELLEDEKSYYLVKR